MEPTARPRALLLAELCNPNWVSVPRVGWWHVEAVMRFADVHLVTHERNRDDILASGFPPSQVTFIPAPRFARWITRAADALSREGAMGGGVVHQALGVPAYYHFEHEVWARFGDRLQAGVFDLVHRLTPVSPVMPSTIAPRCRRSRVPFVIGPLNGGLPWPRGFEAEQRREGGVLLRRLRAGHRLLPYHRATRRCAAAIIAGSASTWREIPRRDRTRAFYLPENSIDLDRFSPPTTSYAERPLRAAFVGRLVGYKGAKTLLRAAAPMIRDHRLELDIIGDGPEMASLRALVREEGLEPGVHLDGWVDFEALPTRLARSALFAFPSVREFGGAVVMEAMALGLIPIVIDHGGPGELVTDDTGFRIRAGTRQDIAARLRQILEQLCASEPDALAQMGERARQRVIEHFSIEAKEERLRAIYAWVMGERREKPDLAPPAHALDVDDGAASAAAPRPGSTPG